jgi:hypothetical protein
MDLKSAGSNPMGVQVPLRAPNKTKEILENMPSGVTIRPDPGDT